MNPTHIHLLLNHVSIMAAIFSVLLFIVGFRLKNSSVINVALGGFLLSALAAIPVFLTGESAEESVEELAGVLKSNIESHEDAAKIALWLIEITGIAALAGLFLKKVKFVSSASFGIVMMLFSLCSTVSIVYAGYLGGKIRHTELSVSSVTQGTNENEKGESAEEEEDKD